MDGLLVHSSSISRYLGHGKTLQNQPGWVKTPKILLQQETSCVGA